MADRTSSPSVLILGGGADQALLVKEFKRRGWRTIVMDYYENPPARQCADLHCRISCYDCDAALELARLHGVDRVATICTDQPLVVAACVSEHCGLYTPLTYAAALRLTNKQHMKAVLTAHGIPTPRHVAFSAAEPARVDDARLAYPLVVKPADSSGSRGVSIVRERSALADAVTAATQYTRCGTLIAEEFIEGYEVSVDAMVIDRTAHVLMISDNYKVNVPGKTALAARSQYPSRLPPPLHARVADLVRQLAAAFALDNVPLFVQMLVRGDELYVMELSARLAGGSKPLFIQSVTGVDVVHVYVNLLLRQPVRLQPVEANDTVVVHYVYCNAGTIGEMTGFQEAHAAGQICWYALYRAPGDSVRGWEHGGDRVAAYAIRGATPAEIEHTDTAVEMMVRIISQEGHDMLIRGLHY